MADATTGSHSWFFSARAPPPYVFTNGYHTRSCPSLLPQTHPWRPLFLSSLSDLLTYWEMNPDITPVLENQLNMGKGDPKKPRGKMSSYAFFVQTCREEHKKKHPDASVNFSEFSKKCSERWKTMSAKEKGKFEDMAKADKARYEREMKTYIPPKGETKKKFKDPNAPKRPPSAFFLFCSEYRPKIKGEHPGLSIGDVAKKLGEMWNNTAADDKQPYEKKAAKLKEKYEKDIAAYRAKGKPDAAKKGVVKAEKSKKKKEEEDDEEDEEDEEEEEEEEDEDEEEDDDDE